MAHRRSYRPATPSDDVRGGTYPRLLLRIFRRNSVGEKSHELAGPPSLCPGKSAADWIGIETEELKLCRWNTLDNTKRRIEITIDRRRLPADPAELDITRIAAMRASLSGACDALLCAADELAAAHYAATNT